MMIQINITGERNLVLNLRRLKTCRKGIYHFLLNIGKSQETCYAFFTAYSFFTVITHLNKPPYTHSPPLLPLKMHALHVLGSKETFINNFLIIVIT